MAHLVRSQVREIVANRKPGTTPEGVIAALREEGHTLEGYSPDATRTGPPPPNDPAQAGRNRQDIRNALRGLTTGGGMAGGIIAQRFGMPLPVRSAAAGLGGAIGRSAENFGAAAMGFPDVPQDPLAVLNSLAGAFNEQATLEGAGGILHGLGGSMGRQMARGSLRPSADVLKNFGDEVMETFARERVPVGRYNRNKPRGSEVVSQRREAAAAGQRAAAQRHDAVSRRFSAQEVADKAVARNEKILDRPLTAAERAAVVQSVDDAMNGVINEELTGGLSRGPWQGYTADELLTIRQAGDRGNHPYFARRNAGKAPGTVDPLEADVTEGVRSVLRGKVGGMSEASEETRRLMGLQQAMTEAETRQLPVLIPSMIAGGATGVGALMGGDTPRERGVGGAVGGLAGFFGSRALMDPRFASRLGLALQDPMFLQMLQQLPRAGWAGLSPMLNEPNPESR